MGILRSLCYTRRTKSSGTKIGQDIQVWEGYPMKHIRTNGITYLEPLSGSNEWYWGMDYTSGDR